MTLLVRMRFGSWLYGTATEQSDQDYKGVFLPTLENLLLGTTPKCLRESTKTNSTVKNSPSDVDSETYSLHYFLDLAYKGETVALDMLHAPESACMMRWHPVWADLVAYRSRFYTKNLRALVGYARRQAAKYGIKASRLAAAKGVLEFLKSQRPEVKLIDVWDSLPTGEHIFKKQNEQDQIYEVCGKAMVAKGRCHYYVEMLQKFTDQYGHRAQPAEHNQGIDWKAVSHAFRAAYQTKDIFVHGGFRYPLPEAPFLLAVKQGQLDYLTVVAPALDALLDEVEALNTTSTLPEQVDRHWWDQWLLKTLYDYYGMECPSHARP